MKKFELHIERHKFEIIAVYITSIIDFRLLSQRQLRRIIGQAKKELRKENNCQIMFLKIPKIIENGKTLVLV